MNIFVTYSNDYYAEVRDFACKMALKKGHFDRVLCYTPEDIDEQFVLENKKILETKYGAGLWLWKPYAVNKAITEEAQEGDYVFYCDAASFFVRDCRLITDVMRHKSRDVFACATPLLEKYFTKEQTFVGMGCTNEVYKDTNQFHASFMCFRKCEYTIKFVSEWLKNCCNYNLISVEETQSEYQNPSYFVAHRQDQSIFSLLCKKYRVAPSYDPSQYGLLQDWYAWPNIEYNPIELKRKYPVCIYLHKRRNIDKYVILTIFLYTHSPSFVRRLIAKRRLKKLNVIH